MRTLHRSLISRFGRKLEGEDRHKEQRLSTLAIKSDDLKADGTFSGYGSVFGVLDSYNEIVAAGAFTESLAEWKKSGAPVPILWQHRSDQPIGGWSDLAEDDYGLKGEGRILLDAGPDEKRAWAHMKAGNVRGLSIGYYVDKYEFDTDTQVLTLTKLDLREISVVTFPANREAVIDEIKMKLSGIRRKLACDELLSPREMRLLLREKAGLSGRVADAVVSVGYKNWYDREVGPDHEDEDPLEQLAALGPLPKLELPKF